MQPNKFVSTIVAQSALRALRTRLATAALTSLLLTASLSAHAIDGVEAYRHSYAVSYKGISVGSGVLAVSKQKLDANQWQYSVTVNAKSTGLAKLVGGEMSINDSASGVWDDGRWFPGQFLHRQQDGDGLSVQEMYFNWSNKTMKNNDEGNVSTHNLEPNTIDYGTTFVVLQSMAAKGCVSETYNQLVNGNIQAVTISCQGSKNVSGVPTYAFSASVGGQGFNAWMNQHSPHDLVKFSAIRQGKTTITLSR